MVGKAMGSGSMTCHMGLMAAAIADFLKQQEVVGDILSWTCHYDGADLGGDNHKMTPRTYDGCSQHTRQ